MSNKVDERIVQMRFDNTQFENGIAQSIKSIQNLKDSLNFDNSISSSLNSLGSSVDTIASKFSVMGISTTTWVAKIADSIGNLANGAIQNLTKNVTAGYNRYNEMMESIQTIMYATRNQWDDTDAQMDYVTEKIERLNWYTDETSYNLSDMTNSIGKFVSAGVSLDDAVVSMQGIASWAALSGQNAEKASYAMYNLSQAMAMGALKAQDWKSIENANMATREFKETAINTAVALGTLEQYVDDEGNWFTYVLRETKSGFEEIEVTVDNFRTTLRDGWFDTEVMTAVLNKYGEFSDRLGDYADITGIETTKLLQYIDEAREVGFQNWDIEEEDAWLDSFFKKNKIGIENQRVVGEMLTELTQDYYELGNAAFKAAQESKTFKDSLMYTEDALTSVWMNIFQDIFGNYLESKELWTGVSELLYEQVVKPVEDLEEVFADWNDLGGSKYIKEAFWNIYDTFAQVLGAIKEGWNEVFSGIDGLDLTILSIKLRNFTKGFLLKDIFGEGAYYSDAENLKNAVMALARAFDVFRQNLKLIAESAKKAWNTIFPKKVDEGLWEKTDTFTEKIQHFAESIEELAQKFLYTDEEGEKLERTFAGLFAIFDMFRMLLIAIIEPFTDIHVEMGEVNHGVLDITASIGDWLVALRDFVKENEIFKKAVTWVRENISKLPDFLDKISRKFLGMGLTELLSKAVKTAGDLFMILLGLFFDFEGTIEKVDAFLTNSAFGSFWENTKTFILNVWNTIKDFFDYLVGKKDEVKGNVIEFFTNIWGNIKGFFETVRTKAVEIWGYVAGFATGAWSSLVGFFDYVREKIQEVFGGTSDESVSMGSKIKNFFSGIGEKIGELWSGTSDKAKSAWETIADFFSGIGKKISEKWSGSKIGEWFTNLGEKIKELWSSLPEKSKEAWSNIKNFFGLVGTTAGDIWDSIPGYIENAWNNIKGFFESIKEKALEIWAKIEPYVSVIADAMKKFGAKISENWDSIWSSIVGFFTWIGENGAKALDWIKSIDWVGWWQEIKKWCEDTWDSIKTFFEELPGKAEEAFKNLTGIDFETFLNNISDTWDKLKGKVQEVWDTISKFIEDLPTKLDDFAGLFGFESWAEMWGVLSKNISDAYHSIRQFFGLEQPEWMTEDGLKFTKLEEDTTGLRKEMDNFRTWKDFISIFKDFSDELDDATGVDWGKQVQTLLGIAAVLGALYLVYKTITSFKGLIDEIQGFNLSTLLFGGFTEPLEDVAGGAKKVLQSKSYQMIADCILEIAAALFIVASIKPTRLVGSVLAVGTLFAMVVSVFSKKNVANMPRPATMVKIGVAFDEMAGCLITIAGALWIVGQVPIDNLIVSTEALIGLFGAIISALTMLDSIETVQPANAKKFAEAVGGLSVAMLVVAVALTLMSVIPLEKAQPMSIALGAVFGALIGALIALDSIKTVSPSNTQKFAEAVGGLSVALLVVAVALALMSVIPLDGIAIRVIALVSVFGALVGALIALDSVKTVKPGNVMKFAEAVGGLSVAILVVAVALAIVSSMDMQQMITSVVGLVLVFGGLIAALILLDKFAFDADKAVKFAFAVDVMSVALIIAAGALRVLNGMDPLALIGYAVGLSLLFGALGGIVLLGSNFAGSSEAMLTFAIAIAILATSIAVVAAGIWIIADSIIRLSELGPEAVDNLVNGLQKLAAATPGMAENIADAIANLLGGLGRGIVEFFVNIANAINENQEPLREGLITFWQIIIDAFNAIAPQMIEAFGNALHLFLQMLQQVWPEVEAFLLMAGQTALLLLGQLVAGILDILVANGPAVLELLRFLLASILIIIEEFTPRITSVAFNLLLDTLNQIWINIGEITAIATAIGVEIVLGVINGFAEEIDDILDAGWNFILKLIEGIGKGVKDHAGELREKLDEFVENIKGGLKEFLGLDSSASDGELYQVAVQAVADFIRGIMSMGHNVWQAGMDIALELYKGMTNENALDENSPSKTMEEVGEYAIDGLIDGIENKTDELSKGVTDAGRTALKGMEKIASEVKDRVDEIINEWEPPTITPVMDLSAITEGFNDIGSMFNGSSFSLENLAASTNFEMNASKANENSLFSSMFDSLTSSATNDPEAFTQNVVINVDGSKDPAAVADEVSTILQKQVDRRNAVWA